MKRLALVVLAVGCARAPTTTDNAERITVNVERIEDNAERIGVLESALGIETPSPAGRIPSALPAELVFGLGVSDPNSGWIRDAANRGAKFAMAYRYLVADSSGGWATNWCASCPRDGRFARRFMDDATLAGVIPVLTYYVILGMPGGGEDSSYTKLRNTATMRAYFEDFRLLMTVAKSYGRTTLVHLEPDGTAQIQIAVGGNASAYAAVAATGLPELAGLPDTVAGWGQAFGRIRDRVGATNVLIGHHYSSWSTGVDLMRGSGLTADIASNVGRTAAFLTALGSYDVLFTEWLDRDAQTRGIWWDPSDSASLTSASFNRDLAIFTALNRATSRRLVLWQTPHGTSWSTIKSHHAQYVFGPGGAAHRERMGSAGIIAALFGSGATGQTTHVNGWGADGGLYLRGEVAAFQRSSPPTCVPPPPVCTPGVDGGLPLPR